MFRSIFISLFFCFSASAGHLSYKETMSTKTELPPAMAKYSAMMGKMGSNKTTSTIYISGTKEAQYDDKGSGHIIDYDSGKMIHFDGGNKTYYELTFQDYANFMKKNQEKMKGMPNPMGEMSFDIKYKDMKKKKTIAGKKCSMFLTTTTTNVQGRKFKMSSIECWWHPAPGAASALNKAKLTYFKKHGEALFKANPQMKKYFQKFVNKMKIPKEVQEGLKIYSKSTATMPMGAPGQQEGAPAMAMKSITTTQSNAFNEGKVSANKFSPPSGYKKVKPKL